MAARDAILHRTGSERARRAARTYILTFLAMVLPAVAALVAFSLVQAPMQGDLTRVGGFTENAYGWNAPHSRFVPPLVATVYDRPFDIVVIGDSYSVNPEGQTDHGAYWTNHLARQSGLSVVALSIHYTPMRALLDHPVFRARPPRLVILEIVERYVVRNLVHEAERWVGAGFDACPAPGAAAPVRLAQPLERAPVPWHRPVDISIDFDRAVDVLWKSTLRGLDVNVTRARSLALDGTGLFSSRASDRLLVYDDELRLAHWRGEEVDRAACRLRAIQDRVQADGRTAFLFVAAPNKLSVYADRLADRHLAGLDKLQTIYEAKVNQVRLLEPLRQAVRCGQADVYLPNDTHWGTPGHEIVARSVVGALRGQAGEAASAC